MSDRDAMPLVRVPPQGFEHCIRGRTGKVGRTEVEFDVTKTGRVTNVRVVDSLDPCFDKYVVRAVSRWRYSPKMVDGEALPRYGVRSEINFDVEATG
ncbi:energy transducer TonB [Parvularcula maris]|uniref:Energy transducer TonB n=1 Tax=Parvularcula maris TaxID=2965077 RepID=A0A9X2L865_9PROT|nr:energy transducer TonB [Parvularcula maris]MCQ8184883.1 energy transducer TonB [Parvularcula maris]